jgi:hypothetical protein
MNDLDLVWPLLEKPKTLSSIMAEKKEIFYNRNYLKPPCIKYTKMYTCKCRVLLAIDVDHYLNSFSCNGRKEDILQQKYLKPPLCIMYIKQWLN